MISSENFIKTCDCVIFYPYPIINDKPRRVFISYECNQTYSFERTEILTFLKNIPYKYEVVYHSTDIPFDKFKFETLRHYVSHIYAVNCEIQHPMITQLPLGFSNGNYIKYNYETKKDILCYLNTSYKDPIESKFNMAISLRKDCREFFKTQKFVTIDENIPFDEFVNKLYNSKFVICPFGYGLDTYRFYEAYASGAIPIVITSGLDSLYNKFGALIVESWSDVTEELLINFIKQPYDQSLLEIDSYIPKLL